MLRVFLPHLAGWNAARREAAARYAELGLGELVELPVDEPGSRLPHVRRSLVPPRRDRRRRSAEAGIACASYYATPTHLQPAMRYLGVAAGSLPETERAAAENLALPMWGGIERRAAGARRRGGALGGGRPRVAMRSPVNRHRLWQVAVDAALVAAAWVLSWSCASTLTGRATTTATSSGTSSCSSSGSRSRSSSLFGFYNRWWRYVSTRDMWGVLRGVVARGHRHVPRLHAPRLPPGEGAARNLGHRPAPAARLRHGRPAARAHAHRAARGRSDRGARQGGHDRRSGRRGAADPPRDAPQSRRSATRRSASSTTIRARRTFVSTGSACSVRPPSFPRSSAIGARTSSSSRSRLPSGDVRERIVGGARDARRSRSTRCRASTS